MPTPSAGAVLRLWFEEVWNRREAGAVEAYLAADGIVHAVDETGRDAVGPDDFREFFRRITDSFSDIRVTVHEVVENGELAAGRWTAHGTHDGGGLGVPPTGEAVTISGMSMVRVRAGRVVESWEQWDRLRLATACRMMVPATR